MSSHFLLSYIFHISWNTKFKFQFFHQILPYSQNLHLCLNHKCLYIYQNKLLTLLFNVKISRKSDKNNFMRIFLRSGFYMKYIGKYLIVRKYFWPLSACVLVQLSQYILKIFNWPPPFFWYVTKDEQLKI